VQPADDGPDRLLIMLTPRERQVAAAVAAGASNQQVAKALSMAAKTVECHLDHIYTKVGVSSRVQLAVVLGIRSCATLTGSCQSLTRTEHRVATLIGVGMSNRLAANQLYLSEKAVEYHLRNIYRKLSITSRSQLHSVLLAAAAVAPGGEHPMLR
jgi:DNA-binding NarL/FixJ family response regulator